MARQITNATTPSFIHHPTTPNPSMRRNKVPPLPPASPLPPLYLWFCILQNFFIFFEGGATRDVKHERKGRERKTKINRYRKPKRQTLVQTTEKTKINNRSMRSINNTECQVAGHV